VHHLRGAVIGIVAFVSIVFGVVIACIYLGYAPMAADTAPSALEADLAMKAVHAVSEREMGDLHNALAVNDANLLAGLQIYRQKCILCHGAADGKVSTIAAGFSVAPPAFAVDGAEDDPEGATYWKIRHGIRFTAMPSFRRSLTDRQMWQVAMFLKHMDGLPKPIEAAWKATPSVGELTTAATHSMQMK
jgi:thiosulfate dehydrogenase